MYPDDMGLAFAIDPVQPNPMRSRDLVVRCSLANAQAARIELLDIAGRVVRSATVSGAGSHTLSLSAGPRLSAGLYVIRLAQESEHRSRRVMILD